MTLSASTLPPPDFPPPVVETHPLPPPAPPAPDRGPSAPPPRHRRRWPIVLVVVAALAGIGVVAWVSREDGSAPVTRPVATSPATPTTAVGRATTTTPVAGAVARQREVIRRLSDEIDAVSKAARDGDVFELVGSLGDLRATLDRLGSSEDGRIILDALQPGVDKAATGLRDAVGAAARLDGDGVRRSIEQVQAGIEDVQDVLRQLRDQAG